MSLFIFPPYNTYLHWTLTRTIFCSSHFKIIYTINLCTYNSAMNIEHTFAFSGTKAMFALVFLWWLPTLPIWNWWRIFGNANSWRLPVGPASLKWVFRPDVSSNRYPCHIPSHYMMCYVSYWQGNFHINYTQIYAKLSIYIVHSHTGCSKWIRDILLWLISSFKNVYRTNIWKENVSRQRQRNISSSLKCP